MFHGIIRKITLTQFFLRHGVYGIYIVLHIDYVFLTERHVREQSMLDTWQLYYCLADSL